MQVTAWPLDPQVQPGLSELKKVKAEFSVSMTFNGLPPLVGSPVGPVPVFLIFNVNCAFCPCVKLSVLSVVAVTAAGFSVKFRHHPPVAPVVEEAV